MANFLETVVVDRLRELYAQGASIRAAATALEISKITVSRYYRIFFITNPIDSPRCDCGRAVTHKGMCRERLALRRRAFRSDHFR